MEINTNNITLNFIYHHGTLENLSYPNRIFNNMGWFESEEERRIKTSNIWIRVFF